MAERTRRWANYSSLEKPEGVGVLDGFAITTEAYWRHLEEQNLRGKLEDVLSNLGSNNLEQLAEAGYAARTHILQTQLPDDMCEDILDAYHELVTRLKHEPEMAVRSSASAEEFLTKCPSARLPRRFSMSAAKTACFVPSINASLLSLPIAPSAIARFTDIRSSK